MHFRHRQMDTDIVAKARDVYITSRAKNECQINHLAFLKIWCRDGQRKGRGGNEKIL